jgi:hypothetical protein
MRPAHLRHEETTQTRTSRAARVSVVRPPFVAWGLLFTQIDDRYDVRTATPEERARLTRPPRVAVAA